MLLDTGELDHDFISSARIFHYGSITLISEPSRSSTFDAAAGRTREWCHHHLRSELRLSLWPDADSAKHGMIEGLRGANVVKLSEEELLFITGKSDLKAGAETLMDISDSIALVLVTRGPDGCFYATRAVDGHVPGVPVEPLDTTGAGDAFVGATLFQLLQRNLDVTGIAELDNDQLDFICKFANAAGALATTKRGAITSLPTHQELLEFLNQ